MTITLLRIMLVLNVFWAINLGLRVGVVGSGEVLAFLFVSVTLNWVVSREGNTFRLLQREVSWKLALPLIAAISYFIYTR